MKTIFAIITLISALSASPILAADNDTTVPSIQERLTQTDLSVILNQYQKVQQLAANARLELALLETRSDEATDKDRAAIAKRIKILESEAQELRDVAFNYDKQIQESRREIAATNKQN